MLATLIPIALRLTVIALGLAVGSHTTTRALRATRTHHAIVRRSLFVLLIGAPLLAFFTVAVLPLSSTAAAFLLLVALCPGAPMIITVGSLAMGHWAGRPRRDDERAVATMAALGNPALGAAVVASLAPDVKTGALVAAYVLARALVLLPYSLVMRKKPAWRSA